MSEITTVYRCQSAPEAHTIRQMLESEGMQATVDGEMQAGHTGLFDISVVVKTEDAERARQLIEEKSA